MTGDDNTYFKQEPEELRLSLSIAQPAFLTLRGVPSQDGFSPYIPSKSDIPELRDLLDRRKRLLFDKETSMYHNKTLHI